MVRPAPSVDRVTLLLDFLAAHPDERFTLSELARRLQFNKATCSTVLAALTKAGYLHHDPTNRSYRLGPALSTLGDAVRSAFRSSELRDQVRRLSAELGLECLASTVVDDEIMILDRAGPPQSIVGLTAQPGQRVPLVPPMGTVFLAWATPAEIERWLLRVGPSAAENDLDRYRAALDAVRLRGYAVALEPTSFERSSGESLSAFITELRHEEYVLVELDLARNYRVNHIAAPVFGPTGRVEFALAILGFHDTLSAAQVPEFSERLLEATRAMTGALNGHAPRNS